MKDIEKSQDRLRDQLDILAVTLSVDVSDSDRQQTIWGDASLLTKMDYISTEDALDVSIKHRATQEAEHDADNGESSALTKKYFAFPPWDIKKNPELDKENQKIFLKDFFNVLYTNLLVSCANSALDAPDTIVAPSYGQYLKGNVLFRVLVPEYQGKPFVFMHPASLGTLEKYHVLTHLKEIKMELVHPTREVISTVPEDYEPAIPFGRFKQDPFTKKRSKKRKKRNNTNRLIVKHEHDVEEQELLPEEGRQLPAGDWDLNMDAEASQRKRRRRKQAKRNQSSMNQLVVERPENRPENWESEEGKFIVFDM